MTESTPSPGSASGSAAQPTPGWHDDPHRRFEYRYYNGQRWTADVSTNGVRAIDPTGQPVAVSSTSRQPTFAPADPRRSRRLSLVSFWVALGSLTVAWVPFLFIGAAAGAVVAVVFGVLAFRALRETGGEGRRFALAGVIMGPIALALCVIGAMLTVVVVREVERFTQPGQFELTENLPCAISGSTVTFSGTITNDENDRRGYSLTIEYSDAGNVVRTDVIEVDSVAPRQRQAWNTTAFIDGTDIACRVARVSGPRPFGLPSP